MIPKLLKKDAMKLDVLLQLDLYNRFFKKDTDKYSNVIKYFKKEAKNMPWDNWECYGIKNKILLTVDKRKKDGATHIMDFFVSPKYRGKGLGTSFLKAIQEKYDKLYLNVFARNKEAIKLYKKLGFKIEKEYDEKGEPCYLMNNYK